MGLPRLQTCCFVLDLKTGNIVMGCFNAFLSFVLFVVMITETIIVGNAESELEAVDADKVPTIDKIEAEAQLTGLYAMSIILVFMFLAKMLFDIIFVYGVITERRGVIKAYMIMWSVFFILSGFTFFINVLKFHWGSILLELLHIGVNFYCILLSYSFYKQLNEREEV